MKKFKLSPKAGCSIAITGAYLGITLAVNAIAMPLLAGFNGIERLVGGRENVQDARLVEKGVYASPNVNLGWGKFVTSKGDTIQLYDGADLIYGKFLPNTQIKQAETGRDYTVTSLDGPLSNKILKLKEVAKK